MAFDFEFYSYGAGLVMLGWVCGMMFRSIMNVLKTGQDAA